MNLRGLRTSTGMPAAQRGFLLIMAVVLIVVAYAVPISHLYMMERFPSLPQKPF